MSNNTTISARDITRIANGKVAYIWSDQIYGDRDEMERFMRSKAREIREANPHIHLHLVFDWYPEEVPVDMGDYTDWVVVPVANIMASRK